MIFYKLHTILYTNFMKNYIKLKKRMWVGVLCLMHTCLIKIVGKIKIYGIVVSRVDILILRYVQDK